MRRLGLLIATCGYLGFAPLAPGTVGSAVGVGIFFTPATLARMLLRLLRIVNPAVHPRCLEGSPESGRSGVEAVRAAVACGLLEESDTSWVPGREFTRGLDRVRIMATGKGDLE